MSTYSLTYLSDSALDCEVPRMAVREGAATAMFLAHLAEFDARRRYAPAGYASMYAYCVGRLHLSEDAAYKRIQAARAARRFPCIFAALAEGRLHLAGVGMLAPYLTSGNADDLIREATHKTRAEIEEVLARRFPRPDLEAMVRVLPSVASRPVPELAPAQVGCRKVHQAPDCSPQLAPAQVRGDMPEAESISGNSLRPDAVAASLPRARLTPLAPGRYGVQFTMDRETRELLAQVQALLGQRVPSGDIAEVFKRALKTLVGQLEKEKFAATDMPRPRRRRSRSNPRHIPAHVKREVWRRDGGRCTFIGENGHRCDARKFLEFDHIEPVARGGQATSSSVRLRCRTHNQFEAERVFGEEFMRAKRQAGRRSAAMRGAAAG